MNAGDRSEAAASVERRMAYGPSRWEVAVSGLSGKHPTMHRAGWDAGYAWVTSCGRLVQGQRGWATGLPEHFHPALRKCKRCYADAQGASDV